MSKNDSHSCGEQIKDTQMDQIVQNEQQDLERKEEEEMPNSIIDTPKQES